jgi:hypothetical protein
MDEPHRPHLLTWKAGDTHSTPGSQREGGESFTMKGKPAVPGLLHPWLSPINHKFTIACPHYPHTSPGRQEMGGIGPVFQMGKPSRRLSNGART